MVIGWPIWHQGDWEMAQVVFQIQRSAYQEPVIQPVGVTFSQHYYGQGLDWNDRRIEKRDGRPVFYVALGSHATYPEERDDYNTQPKPSEWPGDDSCLLRPNDSTKPARRDPYDYTLRKLPRAVLEATLRWGAQGAYDSSSGPRGPGHRDEGGLHLHLNALDFHERWLLPKQCKPSPKGTSIASLDR
jgi:hypothetical protein